LDGLTPLDYAEHSHESLVANALINAGAASGASAAATAREESLEAQLNVEMHEEQRPKIDRVRESAEVTALPFPRLAGSGDQPMWQCLCGMENADDVRHCAKCQYSRYYVKRVRGEEESRRSAKAVFVEEERRGNSNSPSEEGGRTSSKKRPSFDWRMAIVVTGSGAVATFKGLLSNEAGLTKGGILADHPIVLLVLIIVFAIVAGFVMARINHK
jgi:hypothetical protein